MARGDVSLVLRTAELHRVVVVRVAMTQPLEVKGHTQVGQVQEADIIIPVRGDRY